MKNNRGKSAVAPLGRKKSSRRPKTVRNGRITKRTEKKHLKNYPKDQPNYRPLVIIDGTDVAMNYGQGRVFSVKGIEIALRKYQQMQQEAIAIVPQKTMKRIYTDNHSLIQHLNKIGDVLRAPGKNLPNGGITECNPDRFILEAASEYNGKILTNSNYDKILHEKASWQNHVRNGNLQRYQFRNDEIELM